MQYMNLVKYHDDTVQKLRKAGCVFAEEEASLLISAALSYSELTVMVEKRVSGLPMEYVLGWAKFCGLKIKVDRGVFVPRRRTEFLVQQAKKRAKSGPIVVDLCCGTGALGVALVSVLDHYELHAADIDSLAVNCAHYNVTAVGGNVYEGDLFDPLPKRLRNHVDILMVNAPYVPTDEIEFLPAEAREYEATAALDGGSDGLDIHRRVAAFTPLWLAPGGHLFVETSERQASQTIDIFSRNGLSAQLVRCEEMDATVVIGTKSA
jgi:release factor glutamine methyltransferase